MPGENEYNFSLTTFSPSGKLVQIEYALNGVAKGSPTIGIKAKDGVVIAAEKKMSSTLIDDNSFNKIEHFTENIGVVAAGMPADFRIVVKKGRKEAIKHKLQYGENIPGAQLVKKVASVMQEYTHSGGVRPFGISLLVASYDENGPQLFQIDPSGAYFPWKAAAIGSRMQSNKSFLERRHSNDLELEDAIHIAILTLKDCFEGELTNKNIEIGIVGKSKKFEILTPDIIADYLNPPIVNLNENKPLGDILVEFIGLNRISQSNFRRHVELIKSSTNVIELLQNINHTNQVLSQLGIFQPFERNGHEAYAFADIKRGANPGDVKVEISVKEQRPNCSFGANVDSRSNAGFEAKATIPGFMGYINNLELNANISGTSSNQLDCILNIPQPFGFNIYGSLQLFKTMQDNSYQSSFFADIKGLNLSLRDSKSRHCFSWGTSIRDLVPLYNDKRRASESILSSCGRSIKNSVKYKFHRDEIETDQVPISGNATSCSLEFGIAGGDSRFAKFEAEALYAKKLNDFMVFNLMASVGYLNHLPVYHKKSHLLDRFYFSGTSGSSRLFRGFSKLIGPFDTGFRNDDGQWKPCYDYLGGDYYSNVQITMYFLNKKVPFFQPMLCTNLGTLSSLKGSDLSNIYSQAANDLRASVGAGVSMNVGTGVWLECCISYPLLSQQNDVPSNVHIGLRFKPS